MSILEPVLAQLLIHGLNPQQPRKRRHRKAGLALIAFSSLFSLIGVIYLFVALNHWLGSLYGPALGSLMTGGIALLLGGIASTGMYMLESREPKARGKDTAEDLGEVLFTALEKATRRLEEPIGNNPKSSVLMATVAGFVAGDKVH
jgi:hypothetical protein